MDISIPMSDVNTVKLSEIVTNNNFNSDSMAEDLDYRFQGKPVKVINDTDFLTNRKLDDLEQAFALSPFNIELVK